MFLFNVLKVSTNQQIRLFRRPVFFSRGSAEPKGPPVVSKGCPGVQVLRKKLNCGQHLRPLSTFSRLLVGSKCIYSWGCDLNHAGGA